MPSTIEIYNIDDFCSYEYVDVKESPNEVLNYLLSKYPVSSYCGSNLCVNIEECKSLGINELLAVEICLTDKEIEQSIYSLDISDEIFIPSNIINREDYKKFIYNNVESTIPIIELVIEKTGGLNYEKDLLEILNNFINNKLSLGF